MTVHIIFDGEASGRIKISQFPTVEERRRNDFKTCYDSLPQMRFAIRNLLRKSRKFVKNGTVRLIVNPGLRRDRNYIFYRFVH